MAVAVFSLAEKSFFYGHPQKIQSSNFNIALNCVYQLAPRSIIHDLRILKWGDIILI